jgi:hypothetical protein
MITVVDQVRPWLIAEQHVGEQDPAPRRRPHQQEGHRDRDQPAADQDLLASEAVGPAAGEVVGQRLGHAEHDDERQHRRARGEVKLLLGDRRQDAALHADHRADERVDDDQQGELRQVLADAEPQARSRRHRTAAVEATGSRASRRLGRDVGDAAMNSSRSSASSGLLRRSNARVVEGLPLMPAPHAEPAKCAG